MPRVPDDPCLVRVANSTRERLKAASRSMGTDTMHLERRFVIERFLHRLSRSPEWADVITLKGGILLVTLGEMHRPTEDVDAHCGLPFDDGTALRFVRDVCAIVPAEQDGLLWEPERLATRTIVEAFVPGLRIEFPVRWATDLPRSQPISMKLDLAWGDEPLAPVAGTIPSVLPKVFPEVGLPMYRWEQVLAEKVHALARHGILTTRMKDLYDLALLSSTVDFDASAASEALAGTFSGWGRPPLSDRIDVLEDPDFPSMAGRLWTRYLSSKNDVKGAKKDLAEVVADVAALVLPLRDRMEAEDGPVHGTWSHASGGWTFPSPSFSPSRVRGDIR